MSATSTNYSGRKVDLFIFRGATPTGDAQIDTGFGSAGEMITGIEKLMQSFLSLFLTRIGTVPSRPTLGSDFVTAMQQGRILDDGDVIGEFSLAVEGVRSVLALEAELYSLPDDETFKAAVLEGFELDRTGSKLTLRIRIESAAGISRTVYLPVPVAIR